MTKLKQITAEVRAEFKKWTGNELGKEIQGKKNLYEVIKPDGTKSYIHITNILGRIESKKPKTKPIDFKINKERQIKKEWDHLSCSITKEEKKEFLAIAKHNEMTANELLRSVVLKVIESNK